MRRIVDQDHSNILLVLMRLDLDHPNPLRGPGGRLDESKKYQLLVAVVDPSQRLTSAPVAVIELLKEERKAYNRAIYGFQRITDLFYNDDGFVDHPSTYTNASQRAVFESMSQIGLDIWGVFDGLDLKHPVRNWFENLLATGDRQFRSEA